MKINPVIDFSRNNQDVFLSQLKDFIKIPSISSNPSNNQDIQNCAKFVYDDLKRIGFTHVEIIETKKHPIVYGELFFSKILPTVLIYGHYDVQPINPIELWHSPPFEATIRDGRLYGRGTVDDKGQVHLHLKAIESWMKVHNKLPVNIKFIIEGEEEIGSENLEPFIKNNKMKLDADLIIISDTSMIKKGFPSITYGLRGISYFQIDLKGTSQDLHSGMYGGAVKNPINALVEILSKLRNSNGKILIPNFYDNVRKVLPSERKRFSKLPFDELEFQNNIEAPKLFNEKKYSILESLWCRPSLDINGIWGGFTEIGSKTVIPSEAHAKVSIRLVPDQNPTEIETLFEEYVKKISPEEVNIQIKRMHGGDPFISDITHPAFKAASKALEKGFGKKAVFIREGGSIPIVNDMCEVLKINCLLIGFGLPGENAHAPNEWLDLENYRLGIESVIHLYKGLSEVKF